MGRTWHNWARTVSASPHAWHEPPHEPAVVELVRGASGRTLRVVGGGHSWSAIAAPDEIGITLDQVTGITAFDPTRGLVTARAGMRLRVLDAALAARGFALPIVGSIAEQSLAGAIATGTHGSSLTHGNLATLVDNLRLVDGVGRVHELTGERLDAARVHLGALGIVTELTVRIVPAFRLAETVETVPVEDVADALPAIATSAEYVKVWWLPHTRHALVFRCERTDELATGELARRRWFDENIMHGWVFPGVLRLGRMTRRIAPWIAKGLVTARRVGPSTLILSTPMPARHRETEAAVPLAAAGDAFARVMRAIDRERLTVNFIVEARFVRGDAGWMSPAYGGDTCQLGAYCHGPDTDRYFAAFWREMRALGGRPHWGKELDHTVEDVRALWPLADRFRALRDELDPERVFATAFHTRILGR